MKIIDTKRDFYDHFSNDNDSLVYDRRNSISLVKEYPALFSTSCFWAHNLSATLIVVSYGGRRKESMYIRVWDGKSSSTLYINPLDINNAQIFEAYKKAKRIVDEALITIAYPLLVGFIDLRLTDVYAISEKDLVLVDRPIISGSILEYCLSARSVYNEIEECLLMLK